MVEVKGFDWEAASPRERDIWIAERVLGEKLNAVKEADKGTAVMDGFLSNYPHGRDNTMKFLWNGTEHEHTFEESFYNYRWPIGNAGYGLRLWEIRRDYPWQRDIEAHVRAWRRPAKPYTSDIGAAFEMEEWVKGLPWAPVYLDKLTGLAHAESLRSESRYLWLIVHAPAEMRAHAAYLALTNESESNG